MACTDGASVRLGAESRGLSGLPQLPFAAQSLGRGHITRRGFLRVGGMTLAALAAADPLGWVVPEANAATAPGSPASPLGPRRLVVLELNGGNGGLNTLIPYGLGRYYDLPARVGVEQARVLPVDKTWGLHPSLVRPHARAKSGPGCLRSRRRRRADHRPLAFQHAGSVARRRPGGCFDWCLRLAGRLVTALGGVAAPVGGLSIASAPSPLILDADARTAAAADAHQGQFAFPDGQADPLRRALAAMSQSDSATPFSYDSCIR